MNINLSDISWSPDVIKQKFSPSSLESAVLVSKQHEIQFQFALHNALIKIYFNRCLFNRCDCDCSGKARGERCCRDRIAKVRKVWKMRFCSTIARSELSAQGPHEKNCLISVNYVQAVRFYSKVQVVRNEKCETSSQNVTTPRRFKVKLISASSQHVQRVPLKFLIKTVRDKATSVIKRSASPKVLLTFSSGDVCRYQGILSFP